MDTILSLIMDAKRKEEGQAIFEFLVFLPFMLLIVSLMVTIGNSINGSINQQKIVRGYFYYLLHNDSKLPPKHITTDLVNNIGLESVGLLAFGWKKYDEQTKPIAPCYKIPIFSKELREEGEGCTPGNKGIGPTQFIRVRTAYGICSANYINAGGEIKYFAKSDFQSCMNL